ncbi:MAG: hypothetical protein EXS36_18320 [Pedosphaera sp.]|nr:hypothetical protein [Pedosphaera sp.]
MKTALDSAMTTLSMEPYFFDKFLIVNTSRLKAKTTSRSTREVFLGEPSKTRRVPRIIEPLA